MLSNFTELKNGTYAGNFIASFKLNPNDYNKSIEELVKKLRNTISQDSEGNKYLIKGVENVRYDKDSIGVLIEELS